MWTGDTYREQCVKYLVDHGVDISGKWNYQFGIFTGTTLVFIYEMFRKYGLNPERILAFDSFEGLPDEQPGIQRNPIWNRHEFNAKYVLNNNNVSEIIAQIEAKLPDRQIPIDWHEGYFCDTLNADFMEKNPKPAFWVDFDVDLYISSKQIFDFMVPNKLMLPGTIISFDDFGGTEEYKGGESLALKEACEKFGMEVKEFNRFSRPGHVQTAFIVEAING